MACLHNSYNGMFLQFEKSLASRFRGNDNSLSFRALARNLKALKFKDSSLRSERQVNYELRWNPKL